MQIISIKYKKSTFLYKNLCNYKKHRKKGKKKKKKLNKQTVIKTVYFPSLRFIALARSIISFAQPIIFDLSLVDILQVFPV